jgi:hypothetical protein
LASSQYVSGPTTRTFFPMSGQSRAERESGTQGS